MNEKPINIILGGHPSHLCFKCVWKGHLQKNEVRKITVWKIYQRKRVKQSEKKDGEEENVEIKESNKEVKNAERNELQHTIENEKCGARASPGQRKKRKRKSKN